LLVRCQLPGATGTAAVTEGQSLWAEGVLKPSCQGPVSGYEEPWQLLQVQWIQLCGQQEPWGLLGGAGFRQHGTAAAASMGNQAC
jgi:hypothetical protein